MDKEQNSRTKRAAKNREQEEVTLSTASKLADKTRELNAREEDRRTRRVSQTPGRPPENLVWRESGKKPVRLRGSESRREWKQTR